MQIPICGKYACMRMELYIGEDSLAEKLIYTFIFINKIHMYTKIYWKYLMSQRSYIKLQSHSKNATTNINRIHV